MQFFYFFYRKPIFSHLYYDFSFFFFFTDFWLFEDVYWAHNAALVAREDLAPDSGLHGCGHTSRVKRHPVVLGQFSSVAHGWSLTDKQRQLPQLLIKRLGRGGEGESSEGKMSPRGYAARGWGLSNPLDGGPLIRVIDWWCSSENHIK